MLAEVMIRPSLIPPLLTATAMALSCAVLSVFVVSRRWAFIGEGIAHSGFGGAGTVWLLILIFPSLGNEGREWLPYCGVVVFCIATAIGIGYFTRSGKINSDAAIGIFLVASLAWGILAQYIYRHVRGVDPVGWDTFLFGDMRGLSAQFALGAVSLCVAVVAVVVGLGREIVAYAFDPTTAEASGVRVGFIHYLLMILVALTIVIGVRLAGNVLVTALLVLPGATALMLCRTLRSTMVLSLAVALIGTVGGLCIHFWKPFIPTGPAIVLLLFGEFVIGYAVEKLGSR
ncbi:MAG TPA: metal ABC transporter permease [Tepidisphaeraceae bacterium]|jgi:ABC-type Mn2+/Zn2+ transport system permease subunit|nr:metal ABC transporter permease [Tepidisphaeraceae bacterium]